MNKHTNDKIISRYTRYSSSRRAKPGGFRVGLLTFFALIVGFLIGVFAVPKGSAAVYQEALLPLAPDTPLPTASAQPQQADEPSPTADADPPLSFFVPGPVLKTAAPTEEPSEYDTVTLASPVITVSIDGTPTEMLLEDYLVGVVAAEMSASSCPAALEAQAVAARTFTALRMQGKPKCKSGCTVCSDVHCCQAYLGEDALRKAWGKKYEQNIEKIRAAVSATEGLVVTFEGKLISALYHASSGPYTENSEAVFAVALPYLVSVDSFEGEAEMITVQEIDLETAVRKINALFPEADLSVPLGSSEFEILSRTSAGRVQLISVGQTVLSGAQIRKALGLKSTRFTVSVGDTTVVFTCLGYGHGVGMSQTGANEMAKDGASFDEILLHFYTGTTISRLVFDGG